MDVVGQLRASGCVFAEDEAAVLAEAAAGDEDRLARLLAEREAGRPLEQVVGWVDFAGVRVHLDDGVFVPRQRSALLVEVAAAVAPRDGVVLDQCCGSGALLAALLARRPDLADRAHAADLDPTAVACARRNLPPPTVVHEGDLFTALPGALRGRVDVLLLNAPYVPTDSVATLPPEARDHEPRLALDGGVDGLTLHRRVAADVGGWLAPGGALLTEVAPGQTDAAAVVFADAGLTPDVVHDPDRGATLVRATRRGARPG